MLVRVCVDCGEEYRPEVLRCSDCGGELVARDDQGPAGEEGGLGSPVFSGEGLQRESLDATRPIAWSEQARDLVPFANRLVESGIVIRMAPRQVAGEERPRGFELLIRDRDLPAATRVLAALATPESGVTLVAGGHPTEPTQASEESGSPTCPACETPLPRAAEECPECGLAFGGEPAG